MPHQQHIKETIENAIKVKVQLRADEQQLKIVGQVVDAIVDAYRNDRKVLFCGNGGSAADAQHLAAELSARFYLNRHPLDAEALHVNTSYLTATANDFSFDEIYSRLVTAKGKKGDVLVGLSTSGNSPNVVNALQTAKEMGMVTVGLTGSKPGNLDASCDYLIKVPSEDTPRIQEAHILIGHIICELVEKGLFAQ